MKFKFKKGLNFEMYFKALWIGQKQQKLLVSKAESILASKGIHVVDCKDVLRPALVEEPYVPVVEEKFLPEKKPMCYLLSNAFRPLAFIPQSQLITNSLVFDFPDSILEKVKESTDEEWEFVKDLVLHSQVLDAEQVRLPLQLDVLKHPGYRPARQWGLRKHKKVDNIAHYMSLALEETVPTKDLRHILHRASSKVTLNHGDRLMHLDHISQVLVCSKKPMEPVLGPEEVKALAGSPMPDIFPLSPLVFARQRTIYDDDGFAIPGATFAPHTVFMACKDSVFYMKPEQFHAMTLIYAFSFAASYAREKYKGLTGDLEKPVTLNIVHSTERHFHIGRFQLNTLDISSPVKNFFWHEPWTILYEKIGFEAAKPSVEQLNTRPFELLKALY